MLLHNRKRIKVDDIFVIYFCECQEITIEKMTNREKKVRNRSLLRVLLMFVGVFVTVLSSGKL